MKKRTVTAIGFDAYNQDLTGNVSMTLTAKRPDPHHLPCIVIAEKTEHEDICNTSNGGDGMKTIVRRLVPLEAERLQGFPDNWTNIGEWTDSNGKKRQTTDAQRYKALGNSICLPGWFYILRRISAQYERPATMGSLFDGIGGFPLCWERCNGKGTAIWASEIEEFPIAVTKKHFPEGDE